MKVLFCSITLALLCATNYSQNLSKDSFKPQPKPDFWRSLGPASVLSTSICVGGQSLDIASSTGYEANSFLRGSDGRMNRGKAAAFKLSACIVPTLFDRKLPRWARIGIRIGQFTGGGIGLFDAVRNGRVNRRVR